jgi:CheY-like chemotaxis protein
MPYSSVSAAARPLQILVVDDNKNGLLCRTAVIRELGYEVTAANSAEEALELFASSTFHLVVTDYRMPRMNGAQLIAKIRETHPSIPIILVSGLVDALGLDEKSTGADIVIAKNNTEVAHMTRSLNRLLKRKTPKKPPRAQDSPRAYKAKTV